MEEDWLNLSQSEDTDKYNPFTIYRQSSDNRGHSQTVATRVSPEVVSRMHKVIHHLNVFDVGYETPAEFFRDAIIHRIFFWEEEAKGKGNDALAQILKELRQEMLQSISMSYEERERRSQTWVTSWQKNFEAALKHRSLEEMMRLHKEIFEHKDALLPWHKTEGEQIMDDIQRYLGFT